ncbi:sensor histidine kinase [Undibacterium oligocarboniphilum]|uniref:histidine kinase n=1 Tax=Undibacterium oligocarboniphilum TaxID=666702 RepID=A0A850QHK9_9BURK|nr:HAMP domain-containing sensor histidine kinase [Undibacterium oligocarboniphilum]MBC3870580.1 HAMP domain-containing histidine kinase [Undibacterium oligocarboniphilum]NVO78619.1 HAMP domain-containing histidine kinase [Undibacterium oligocarboniphilum]
MNSRIWQSSAFRLSLICGAMVIISVATLSTAFYLRTVGVLERNADEKITQISERLLTVAENGSLDQVKQKIHLALSDGIDSDTEIYFLGDPNGRQLAGNLNQITHLYPLGKIVDEKVIRDGRLSQGRLLIQRTQSGNYLVVGRDMSDLREINLLIWRAIGVGSLLAIMLSIGGTVFFRSQIEKKIWAIRHAAQAIETGNLRSRIEITSDGDEFTRLSADLNRMLDRIEHLMDGIRHVSNNIAHNIRTPLGRIRAHLEENLRAGSDPVQMRAVCESAIAEIDGLISLLGKLMQLAEAESEMRRQHFQSISLNALLADISELYEPVAEEFGMQLNLETDEPATISGDYELLSCALANLLDNTIKYAGAAACIRIRLHRTATATRIEVSDNGPGIPEQERQKVLQRFYRLHSDQPGHGLGLSMVNAIIRLHGGQLNLEDAGPGLCVSMTIPLGGR